MVIAQPLVAPARERVAKGADWLDENHPGWERRLDLRTLSMADPCQCVIAQLGTFGFFLLDLRSMKPKLDEDDRTEWAAERGFTTYTGDWVDLNLAWGNLIMERIDRGTLSG